MSAGWLPAIFDSIIGDVCGGGTEIFEQSIVNAVTTAGNGGGEGAGFTRAPTSFVPYVTGKQATLANRGVKETSRKFPQYDKELRH